MRMGSGISLTRASLSSTGGACLPSTPRLEAAGRTGQGLARAGPCKVTQMMWGPAVANADSEQSALKNMWATKRSSSHANHARSQQIDHLKLTPRPSSRPRCGGPPVSWRSWP